MLFWSLGRVLRTYKFWAIIFYMLCMLYLLCTLVHTPSIQYVWTIFPLLYFIYSNFFLIWGVCTVYLHQGPAITHASCTPHAHSLHAPCTPFLRAYQPTSIQYILKFHIYIFISLSVVWKLHTKKQGLIFHLSILLTFTII